MKKGKLIVIDGIDGSGKATQVALLAQRLKKAGKKVKTIDFPRYYDNVMGKLVGDCLAGKHGDFAKLDPYIASVLYAADRFESSRQMQRWLDQGYIVLADRYASANQIHQAGKIRDAKKRKDLLEWLQRLEFGVFKIPKPDLVVYLDVTVETSLELNDCKPKEKRQYLEGKRDQHECDEDFQKRSRSSALEVVKSKNNWTMINCLKNGQLMTKETISDMIWDKVQAALK